MKFAVALKRICDITLYLTLANLIVVLLGGDSLMPVVPLFIVVALLAAFYPFNGVLKYVHLLPLSLLLLVVEPTPVHLIAVIPAIVHFGMTLPKKNEKVHEFEYSGVFVTFVAIFLFVLLLSFLFSITDLMENGPIQMGITFMVCATMLLRMLRHDEAVLNQRKFTIINGISLLLVMVMTVVISAQQVRSFIGRLVLNVIVAIIPIIENALYWLFRILAFLFSWWPWSGDIEFEGFGPPQLEECPYVEGTPEYDLYCVIPPPSDFEAEFNPTFLIIIGAILGLIIVYFLFKLLRHKNPWTMKSEEIEEERISLDPKNPKRRRGRRKEHAIRQLYRKTLKAMAKKGQRLDSSFTTEDYEQLMAQVSDPVLARQFRQAYHPIRYGDRPYSKEDIKKFKELHKAILNDMMSTDDGRNNGKS